MSRSYKKTPIVKDNKGGRKFAKKYANKVVRKTKNVPNGKAYRKVTNSWDIYDYIIYNPTFKKSRKYREAETKEEKEQLELYWKKTYKYK